VVAVAPPDQIHRLVWRRRTEQALALAASFVIGVGITALALRNGLRHEDNTASLAPSIQGVSARSQRQDALVKSRIESLPFWSNQRLYLLASASTPGTNTREMEK
jgi:hypothetical protein